MHNLIKKEVKKKKKQEGKIPTHNIGLRLIIPPLTPNRALPTIPITKNRHRRIHRVLRIIMPLAQERSRYELRLGLSPNATLYVDVKELRSASKGVFALCGLVVELGGYGSVSLSYELTCECPLSQSWGSDVCFPVGMAV